MVVVVARVRRVVVAILVRCGCVVGAGIEVGLLGPL